MKKILLALCISLSTLLVGCSENDERLQIGILQIAENGAFTDIREGFLNQMSEYGYSEENVNFDYQNAYGDVATLNVLAQKMVSDKKDLIITVTTLPTQAVLAIESDIPVVYASVSDPLAAGVITDFENPDKNATGVTNVIPVDQIVDLALSFDKSTEVFGFIYNAGEANSVSTVKSAQAYMNSIGVEYIEKIVTSASEIEQATLSLTNQVDAIFCSNDSMIQSAMTQIAQIAIENDIHLYGSSAVMVESGALATVSISDYDVGALTADMAFEFLNGTPINELPANFVTDFNIYVNEDTANTLGFDLSDEIFDNAILIK